MLLLAAFLAYQPVLDKHRVTVDDLRSFGFEVREESLTPQLTPEQLDDWLAKYLARKAVQVNGGMPAVAGMPATVPIVVAPWFDPKAPGELDELASRIHAGKGDPAALRRALARAADMTVEDKRAFIAQIRSPLTLWVALSRSRAPHSVDGRLYFERFEQLLAGRSIAGYAAEVDPKSKHGASFLLRAHSYDALIPYLNRRPEEAEAIAPLLFPDNAFKDTKERADRLEALMTQLVIHGRKSGALNRFVVGLSSRALTAPGKMGQAAAAYLKVNHQLHKRPIAPEVEALISNLTVPQAPAADWPADAWTFTLHFADTDSYRGWLSRFQAEGYAFNGPFLQKHVAGLTVRFLPRLHAGDREGFLRGKEQQRFLASVTRDLRDPSLQGVILRNHAQFRIRNLFDAKVTPGKLFLDGSCRSGWDLRDLRRRCKTCHFIVNTGTGYGAINNVAILAVVEGLAGGLGWEEIGQEWSRVQPRSAARMQGPWTPPYSEALDSL